MAKLDNVIAQLNGTQSKEQALTEQLLVSVRRALDREREEVSNQDLLDTLRLLAQNLSESNAGISKAISNSNVTGLVSDLGVAVQRLNSTLDGTERRLDGSGEVRLSKILGELKSASQALESAVNSIQIPETDLTPVLMAIASIEIPSMPDVSRETKKILKALEKPESWEFTVNRRLSDDKIESVTATKI